MTALTQQEVRQREERDRTVYAKRALKALAALRTYGEGEHVGLCTGSYVEREARRNRTNPHYLAALGRALGGQITNSWSPSLCRLEVDDDG